jgi:hypothetical protein
MAGLTACASVFLIYPFIVELIKTRKIFLLSAALADFNHDTPLLFSCIQRLTAVLF